MALQGITGGIAGAFYKEIPLSWKEEALARLPAELIPILDAFYERYG
ncbi:MAG: hypothetical protein ACP5D1_11240 [Bacteroidales bacterium]